MADGGKPRREVERDPKFVRFTPLLWKRWHSDRAEDKNTAVLREGIDQMRKKLAVKDVSLDDLQGLYSRPDDFKRCKHCGALTSQLKTVSLSEARKAGYDAGWRDHSYEIKGLTYAAANALPPYNSRKHRDEWEAGYNKGFAECF
jgi:hypothetical protein